MACCAAGGGVGQGFLRMRGGGRIWKGAPLGSTSRTSRGRTMGVTTQVCVV